MRPMTTEDLCKGIVLHSTYYKYEILYVGKNNLLLKVLEAYSEKLPRGELTLREGDEKLMDKSNALFMCLVDATQASSVKPLSEEALTEAVSELYNVLRLTFEEVDLQDDVYNKVCKSLQTHKDLIIRIREQGEGQ